METRRFRARHSHRLLDCELRYESHFRIELSGVLPVLKLGLVVGCGVGASGTAEVCGVGCGALGSGRAGAGTGGAAFVTGGAGAGATLGVSAGGVRGAGSIERKCSSV